jgi:UDP-N-acetylglucosamine 2-epimerase
MICGSCHLAPLDLDETSAYIEHRLGKVGWTGTPRFESGAFAEIFRWSHGVPRRINQLCNRILMARALDSGLTIDSANVRRLASELTGEFGLEDDVADAAALERDSRGAARLASRPPAVGRETARSHDAPFLCVASDYGDHVKAAAFIRAIGARADPGANPGLAALLLRVHDNDALAYCGRLYKGLETTGSKIDLGVQEGSPDAIVFDLMTAFARAIDQCRPRAVVVFDGSPTAFACSTVARAKKVAVVHVGAGLRISERFVAAAAMRTMTDHLADVLFTTDAQASQTLSAEGLPAERVHCVGNLVVDSIRYVTARLRSQSKPHFRNHYGYALVVLSEPANMAGRDPLVQLTEMLAEVSRVLPIVWLLRSGLHAQLKKYHLVGALPKDRVHRAPAQPYVEYVALLQGATCVLTDSWTVQEEASALRVPCLVVGVFPERPIPGGSGVSVGLSRTRAVSAVWEYVLSGVATGRVPVLWDGRSGARIAGYLAAWTPAVTTAGAQSLMS